MSGALETVRSGLAGRRAWLVGGAVRDRALGLDGPARDLDVIVEGDPGEAARALARAAGRAASFELSERFAAWRVVPRDRSWQADIGALRGGSVQADLALRDFTVNAIAEPLSGGAPIDPLGGLADARARRLRMAGADALRDDPLRVLRLVRLALELELEADPDTLREARAHARALRDVSPERVFAELRRIVSSPRVLAGVRMLAELGASAVVMGELDALRGVEQSSFHHLDVYEHTLEVLARTVAISDPDGARDAEVAGALGELRPQVQALCAEPLADELSRGEALRWGALLHDAAKPLTREVRAPDGRVTFIGHDARGAEVARSVLGRLRASERLRAHVAALVRHHLRLGFLVHEPQPLARASTYRYLRACAPVEADVTLLSIADRLATRGHRAEESIDAHLRLARGVLADALRWHANGPAAPLWCGDELARALRIPPGPRLGALLEELACAQYAGEVSTREQALALAHAALERR